MIRTEPPPRRTRFPMPTERFWNVPNALTLGRFALSFVVFGLIASERPFAALIVFALAALTDAFDGYFARLLGQSSALGRQLDPLVDKVLITGAYTYLLRLPESRTGLAVWMIAGIVIRELIVQAVRSLIEGRGEAFGARWSGKFKTLLQCLSIAAVLFCLAFPVSGGLRTLRDVLTWSAVVLTLYSGAEYLALGLPKLREARS